MRGSFFGCALALAVFGCSKERSEATPAVASTQAATSSSAPITVTGDEALRLCGQKSICPNEPVDEEGTQLCASLAREPICGPKFLALVKCQIAKEKCDAEGKVDQVASMELCKLEDAALQECQQLKAAAPKSSTK